MRGHKQKVTAEHAVGLHGSGGRVTLEAVHPAHLLVLLGAEIREPVVAEGPFIMNEWSQIEDAVARFRAGKMGRRYRSVKHVRDDNWMYSMISRAKQQRPTSRCCTEEVVRGRVQ